MPRRREGFTLVELLVVMVVVGILAGSLILVFGSANNRSSATRVVSDLMTLKRASVIFFYDTGEWPEESDYEKLNSYMVRDVLAEGWGDGTKIYAIQKPDDSGSVYAAARVGDEYGGSSGIRKLLEKDASKYDLVNENGTPYRETDDIVMVLIRGQGDETDEPEDTDDGTGDDTGGDPGGEDGPDLPDYPDWDSGTVYLGGDYVIYNGKVYQARYWTQGQQPGLLNSPWQEITDEWTFFNIYNAEDIVIVDGKQYKAWYWTQNEEPGVLGSPWQELTDQWVASNRYYAGDTAWYDGKQYRAKWYTVNSSPGSSSAWEIVM